jgi:5-methyltetrahydropteroyltriglutamate--homocysteine methyltransferase
VKLPDGKILVTGVISHSSNVVEHPKLVAERLLKFASVVGRENGIAGSDCGFAQEEFNRRVHPTVMWKKLEAMVEGPKIAARRLWGLPARSFG